MSTADSSCGEVRLGSAPPLINSTQQSSIRSLDLSCFFCSASCCAKSHRCCGVLCCMKLLNGMQKDMARGQNFHRFIPRSCPEFDGIICTHLSAKVLNCDSLIINDVLDLSSGDQELGSGHRHLQEVLYLESHAQCQTTPCHAASLSHENLLTAPISLLPVKEWQYTQINGFD